jgi:MFS family permease
MSHVLDLGRSEAAPKKAAIGLLAIFVTYFSSNFVMFSLNVAQPRIAADLDGMALYSWMISLPALASAFVVLIFSKLSDMYGRQVILIASLALLLAGSVLSALSRSMEFLIVARVVLAFGQGALGALCFSVLGDLYEPAERSKWAGWMSFPVGIAAIIGPTLAGWLTDSLSWRYVFWIAVPLSLISGALVLVGVPSLAKRAAHKIDFLGSVLLAIASSTMILGFSWGGALYPWASVQIIGLLAVSVLFWVGFLWVEGEAEEPMLDLQVLTNRTFITAAAAALMSFFGLMGIMAYYPLFLQGVQGVSATLSGQIATPFNMLMAFMGVPVGLLLARTKRYKWMYIAGYALLVAAMFGMVTFGVDTPVWLGILVTALGGLGLGAIPTINSLVAQFAVPRRLLGAATGGIFFFVMMGQAIAPAILGSAMNASYNTALQAGLPTEVTRTADAATLASLADPRVLLVPQAMNTLQDKLGGQDSALFRQSVTAIRGALEASLKTVFLIGAIAMLVSFLLILTIPEVSLDVEAVDKKIAAIAAAD